MNLQVKDLFIVSTVSKNWRKLVFPILADSVYLTFFSLEKEVINDRLRNLSFGYKHIIFRDCTLNFDIEDSLLWQNVAKSLKSVRLFHLSDKDIVRILMHCEDIEELYLGSRLNNIVKLDSPEDIYILKNSLTKLEDFSFSCIFPNEVEVLNNLKHAFQQLRRFSLHFSVFFRPGAQIFRYDVQNNQRITNFVKINCLTLKQIHLERCSIFDNDIDSIASIPNLNLMGVHLPCCGHITQVGIEKLCQLQTNIIELDLSNCFSLKDDAMLSILKNLPNIKSLKVRECFLLTDLGIAVLGHFKHLEVVDINCLDLSSNSILYAFCTKERRTLRKLCLPSIKLKKKLLNMLLLKNPNLTHLCTEETNLRKIVTIKVNLQRSVSVFCCEECPEYIHHDDFVYGYQN